MISLRITLQRKSGYSLPLSYQYELQGWIYKVLAKADPNFSKVLHEEGHRYHSKRFKLFTFSSLFIQPFKIQPGRLIIEGDNPSIWLDIRFLLPRTQEKFLIGLFQEQSLWLGDKDGGVYFEVTTVKGEPAPLFLSTMQYQCTSPLCVSVQGPEDRHAQYLAPDSPGYGERLVANLVRKAFAAGHSLTQEMLSIKQDFKLLNAYKAKLITIKQGRPEETKVRGYKFEFEATIPILLHKIAYYAGIGEHNSMGFGCIKRIGAGKKTLRTAKQRHKLGSVHTQ